MAKSRFKITPFTNPSGTKVFRVSGTLDGKTIRKNFKDRKLAVAFRDKMDVESLNDHSEGQEVWTTLTQEQNRDAIAAVNMLKRNGSKHSLTFAVNYLLKNYRESELERTVEEAVKEYLDERQKDQKRSIISVRQHDSIRSEFSWFEIALGGRNVSDISAEHICDYMEKPRQHPRQRRKPTETPSLKTWNNRRGLLNTFFEFCRTKKFVSGNPVQNVPQYRIKHRRATAETLDVKQAAELMAFLETYTGPKYKRPTAVYAEGFLVPFFALALFAGVRPDWKNGEICKLRPKDIDFRTNVIRIEPETSKINEKRHIKIQPNLKRWLERYPLPEEGAVPKPNAERILRDVRQRFELGHDVLRHTYISMTVGAFRSVGDAALQAGNSEAVIRKHYLDLKSIEEADQFWRIVPKGEKLEVMDKKDGRYLLASS